MGIKTSSYFKGLLLPLVCIFEVKLSSSEDTLRHSVVNFSPHKRGVKSIIEYEAPGGDKLLSNNSYAKKIKKKIPD